MRGDLNSALSPLALFDPRIAEPQGGTKFNALEGFQLDGRSKLERDCYHEDGARPLPRAGEGRGEGVSVGDNP
jgi:hypothetical protein